MCAIVHRGFGVADKLGLPNSSILHNVISKLHMQHNKFDMLHRLGRVMLIRSILSRIAVLYIDAAYGYRPSNIVCLSVGQSVSLSQQ